MSDADSEEGVMTEVGLEVVNVVCPSRSVHQHSGSAMTDVAHASDFFTPMRFACHQSSRGGGCRVLRATGIARDAGLRSGDVITNVTTASDIRNKEDVGALLEIVCCVPIPHPKLKALCIVLVLCQEMDQGRRSPPERMSHAEAVPL